VQSPARSRKARPGLEALEGRALLTLFTWSSSPADGNWDNPANWDSGQVPKSGPAQVAFPSTATDQTITLQADDANLQITALSIGGGHYTFQGPSANAGQALNLADGAILTLSSMNGGTLTIATTAAPGSLALNFMGSATINGSNTTINTSTATYSGNPTGLVALNLNASNLILGSSAHLVHSRIQFQNTASLIVADGAAPWVGSVNGTGSIQLGISGQNPGGTGLVINTPAGQSDAVVGPVQGNGGVLVMNGAGSFTVQKINPLNAGPFVLQANSGNFGLQGGSQLNQTTLGRSSSFTAYLNGTGAGLATKITATGTTPISLGGSTLKLALGNGYVPKVGDGPFTLISSAHGITGQFGNAPENGIVTIPGDNTTAFRVNYTTDPQTHDPIVLLTVVPGSVPPNTVVSIKSSSAAWNNSTTMFTTPPGSPVSYTATVVDSSNNPVRGGNVTFYYTDDFTPQGWHKVDPIQVDASGQALFSRGVIPTTTTVEAVVVLYVDPANNYHYSWSQDNGDILFQLLQWYHTSTRVTLDNTNHILTATISSPEGSPALGGNVFAGNVQVKKNGVIIGGPRVVNGVATLNVGAVAPGTTFTVQYIPDAAWSIIGSTGTTY
jgi:hypothetical protein